MPIRLVIHDHSTLFLSFYCHTCFNSLRFLAALRESFQLFNCGGVGGLNLPVAFSPYCGLRGRCARCLFPHIPFNLLEELYACKPGNSRSIHAIPFKSTHLGLLGKLFRPV
ncbi:hypothetical protein AVEN_47051-1 [Araneus ventricosus]|uniref:Uncharacterized protein n=1 Tax=Araneus ventricosus TaxID=182803 RepID=A0A4Y2EY48_ARAVE|nr:hypothetical protein AVEN_47051-1 [Araneus ventricosus]